MQKIKAENNISVFLDLDDTILDFNKAEEKALKETFRRLGIEPTEKIISRYSEINLRQWELLEKKCISREETLEGRFRILFDELGIGASSSEANGIYEKLLGVGHFFVPGAEKLLRQLYGKYRLFIVSNGTGSVQDSRLASAGISGYFEDIFISERLGYNKPSREFYNCCFEKIPELDRDKSIVVGDSLTSDILGGINMGIKTCWFNYRKRSPREDIKPDYVIDRLSELPPLLQSIWN